MKKILFICKVNRLRSRTAETLFRDHPGYSIKSAGTAKSSAVPLSEELVQWSDMIFAMETSHKNYIVKKYKDLTRQKRIVVLEIPDDHEYMDPNLIDLLKNKMRGYLD